ncbi:MAG: Ig-like domain-containing protein [Candidatus Paceibacterota bacterium]
MEINARQGFLYPATLIVLAVAIFFCPFFAVKAATKTINLSGSGSTESNYILPLNIHYGSKQGDDTTTDVYLDSLSRTDFADIRFKDSNNNNIPYYLHSTGNYEVIPDNTRLGTMNVILPTGEIVSSNIPGVATGVATSTNNGNSWTVKSTSTDQLLLVSSVTGYYYINSGNLVKRSIDRGATWTTIKDFSADSAAALPYGFTEDASGNLFMGQYQEAINKAILWRSVDNGDNWVAVYDATGDATKQHIHGVGVDPYTNAVYIGVDGSAPVLLKSTNCSTPTLAAPCTWVSLGVQDSVVQMIFGDGWRMFGNETPRYSASSSYSTVFRTTDDVNFSAELVSGQSSRVLRELNGSVFMTAIAQYASRYPQILRRSAAGSVAGGTWETIWAAPYDSTTGNAGPRYANYAGTPLGTSEPQLMVGATDGYKTMRFFNGGNHYQALVYLKVPTIPAGGGQITVEYGNPSASSASDPSIYNSDLVQSGLVSRWKLDEGTGTALVDVTSAKNAVITAGTGGWNGTSGRKVGSNIPPISLSGDSYHFNGDGYAEVTGSGADVFQATNDFTVMAWVRSTSTNTNVKWIVGKGTGAANGWALVSESGILRFRASSTSYNGAYIADGAWHLVGASINSSNELTLFSDGKAQDAVALSPTIPVNTEVLRFGKDAAGLLPFTGDLDDVQYYNTALTGDQMRQIYEARSFNSVLEPAIVVPTKTYYVDSVNGSDSYPMAVAENPATPWKTLQHAEDTAEDGSTVHVAAGTYVENDATYKSWYIYKGLTYIADGPVTVKSTTGATRVAHFNNGTTAQSFTNFTFDAEGLRSGILTFATGVGGKTFTNCTFSSSTSVALGLGASAGTFNFVGSNFSIGAGSILSYLLVGTPVINFSRSYIFASTTSDVLSFNTASNVTLSMDRSVVVAPAVLATNGVFRSVSSPGTVSLTNNTFISNSIFVYQSLTAAGSGLYTLKNNIFYSTRAASGKIIHVQSTGGIVLVSDYNDIYNTTDQVPTFRVAGSTYTTYALYQAAGYEANGTTSNPLLVNYGSGDYHLASTSTLINIGSSTPSITLDKDGLVVPQGSAPDIGAYEYDLTVPAVTVTSPIDGAVISGQVVTFVATSSDNVGLSSLQFFLDGAIYGSATTTSPYSLTWSSATDGAHTIVAVAHDTNGNVATSTIISFTVDNTFPSALVSAPSNGATVSGSVTLTASASDDIGVSGLRFNIDGINYGAESATSPYSLSWDSTLVSDGNHTIVAVARDTSGNYSTSTAVTVNVLNHPAVSSGRGSGGGSVANQISNLISMGNLELANELSAKYNLGTSSAAKASSTPRYSFTRNLKTGSTGSDVKLLQQFLNTHGFIVAKSGPGSVGQETTMFGALTRLALIKFQKANKITPAIGYFGPVTRGVVGRIK